MRQDCKRVCLVLISGSNRQCKKARPSETSTPLCHLISTSLYFCPPSTTLWQMCRFSTAASSICSPATAQQPGDLSPMSISPLVIGVRIASTTLMQQVPPLYLFQTSSAVPSAMPFGICPFPHKTLRSLSACHAGTNSQPTVL